MRQGTSTRASFRAKVVCCIFLNQLCHADWTCIYTQSIWKVARVLLASVAVQYIALITVGVLAENKSILVIQYSSRSKVKSLVQYPSENVSSGREDMGIHRVVRNCNASYCKCSYVCQYPQDPHKTLESMEYTYYCCFNPRFFPWPSDRDQLQQYVLAVYDL